MQINKPRGKETLDVWKTLIDGCNFHCLRMSLHERWCHAWAALSEPLQVTLVSAISGFKESSISTSLSHKVSFFDGHLLQVYCAWIWHLERASLALSRIQISCLSQSSCAPAMANAVEWLDAQLELFFADWNIWTSLLLFIAFFALIYPLIDPSEPDTHPLLLSRQASIAPVRQPGESAVYRALEVPHGFPLKSGLNVRAKGSSRWSAGKDGDIRDIWRRAVEGPASDDGQPSGPPGEILTVYGKEEIEKHDLQSLSRQINNLGPYIKQNNASCVAIYLPNSVELLVTIFGKHRCMSANAQTHKLTRLSAAAFYGLHPVLIPYDQPQEVILRLINMANADFMIATAGSLPLAEIRQQCLGLGEVMWVVEKTSRNVDWSEPSQGASTWHEAVEEPSKSGSVSSALPESKPDDKVPDVITIWQNDTPASGEIVAFTQQVSSIEKAPTMLKLTSIEHCRCGCRTDLRTSNPSKNVSRRSVPSCRCTYKSLHPCTNTCCAVLQCFCRYQFCCWERCRATPSRNGRLCHHNRSFC